MINPWKILKVHRKSSERDIRMSYIKLAQKHHPDMRSGDKDMFHKINAAYSILKNDEVRKNFIDVLKIKAKKCEDCNGSGCKTKSVSMTTKTHTPCKTCYGAGHIIKEKENDGFIKL